MTRKYEEPQIEGVDPILGTSISHPAYGAIEANRVSGHSKLFDSDVDHHNGYVTVSIRQAKLWNRDGFQHVSPGLGDLIEIAMTEAQGVAFVSRMNFGGGTPCTITERRDMDGTYHLIPGIATEKVGADKLDAQAEGFLDSQAKHLRDALEAIKRIVGPLSAKKTAALENSLLHIADYGKGTLKFYKEQLGETNDKLVTSAKVEIDAMVNAAVTKLGLASTDQLGHLLAADPQALMKMLAAPEAPTVQLQIPHEGEES